MFICLFMFTALFASGGNVIDCRCWSVGTCKAVICTRQNYMYVQSSDRSFTKTVLLQVTPGYILNSSLRSNSSKLCLGDLLVPGPKATNNLECSLCVYELYLLFLCIWYTSFVAIVSCTCSYRKVKIFPCVTFAGSCFSKLLDIVALDVFEKLWAIGCFGGVNMMRAAQRRCHLNPIMVWFNCVKNILIMQNAKS